MSPLRVFLLPPHYCGLGAGSIPFRAIVNNKQCETRGLLMSLVIHYWIGDVQDSQGVSAPEMTYIVSGGTLNSTHSLVLTFLSHPVFERGWMRAGTTMSHGDEFVAVEKYACHGGSVLMSCSDHHMLIVHSAHYGLNNSSVCHIVTLSVSSIWQRDHQLHDL